MNYILVAFGFQTRKYRQTFGTGPWLGSCSSLFPTWRDALARSAHTGPKRVRNSNCRSSGLFLASETQGWKEARRRSTKVCLCKEEMKNSFPSLELRNDGRGLAQGEGVGVDELLEEKQMKHKGRREKTETNKSQGGK